MEQGRSLLKRQVSGFQQIAGSTPSDFFAMVTSLFFEVNIINLLTGASPLALAKSI